ncbi:hypothetical protein SAV31267_093850 [Streptomyces avermitilis]|uniref:Uncharacterized protein n=1 Tax=Streptomyces avermitilis TaxID=33903 RepID=A0A4D4N616_STRAX|nr:hypothetical protein SAV31267_093850 [Streptomyces avermitilis]
MGGKGDNCRQQDGQGEGYGQAAERGERSDHGRPCERAEISGCSDGADGSGAAASCGADQGRHRS